MRLGIMQPYFFPYPGHFGLISAVEEWVVFDVTQYTPKSWMNRNRVLHPTEGTSWISVPLANSSISIPTRDARILNPKAARQSILGKLTHYKPEVRRRRYDLVCSLVDAAFGDDADDSLVALNTRGLSVCCERLGFSFRYRICSTLELDFPDHLGAGGWAPFICARLGATSYVNPLGGQALFNPDAFSRIGVELLFAATDTLHYDQGRYAPEPNLSILDALMWNDPAWIADAIRGGTTLRATEQSGHNNRV
ncbi:MAG TPA: WbqC family protein, partial [Rhodopila sp.]|nr:WbqC family protein [Rhodopila sp.]